jgi:hypothetical protein
VSLLQAGIIGGAAGYQIPRSLRLRSSATAYLNRTFGTGDRKKWTFSAWVKRGALGTTQGNLLHIYYNGTDFAMLRFNSPDCLEFYSIVSGVDYSRATTGVFRDPTSHMHLNVVYDSAQVNANDRFSFYINGVLRTDIVDTYGTIPQDYTSYINSAGSHRLASSVDTGTYFDGYLSEVNFIDGQALTPSSFGQIDAITGQWTAKKYVGTYGTNGFYLDFSDPTSATTLCYDRSGNSNNWTPNNISTTAGSTYDSMLDVPLGGGGAERGNYAVLDRLHQEASLHAIRNGNLTCDTAVASSANVVSTFRDITQGKWCWEVSIEASGAAVWWFGVTNGAYNNGVIYYADGTKAINGSFTAYGASFTLGDVIGVAYDAAANTVTFYKNGVSQGAITGVAAGASPWFGDGSSSASTTFSVNFGQRPFSYTPPTDFKALHTGNLTTPTGAALEPKKHFDALLYTGNGGTKTVAGALFAPDFVWPKGRSVAYSHGLYDTVRGAGKKLSSNLTGAELGSSGLQSFTSDGFTLDSDAGTNENAASYVAWLWKAGGTAVTNTAGTISSQVSANVAAGFSIVTYTGTGAAATVGHGLGVAPKLVIVKQRNGVLDWPVYHASSGNTGALFLNLTNAFGASANFWQNTTPSSSVVSVGTANYVNSAAATYVAYCFAEIAGYSKIGSYTGNGSADGPMVWCGLKPRFLMIKRTDSTGDWVMLDTSRSSYNVATQRLYTNVSNAEDTSDTPLDILSSGFKLRTANVTSNASGGTYIFYVISEASFKYSLAK